jgi:hypothetical protein
MIDSYNSDPTAFETLKIIFPDITQIDVEKYINSSGDITEYIHK